MDNESIDKSNTTDGESNSSTDSDKESDNDTEDKKGDQEEWKTAISQRVSQLQESVGLMQSQLLEHNQRIENVEVDLDAIPSEQTVLVKAETQLPAVTQTEQSQTQQPITGWRKLVKAILS